MLFNSVSFLIFFPIVVGIYFFVPKKLRYIWLLITSYFFYMSWNAKYAVLILTSTVTTYVVSLFIQKVNKKQVKKILIAAGIIFNLSILIVFKYSGFLSDNINYLLDLFHLAPLNRKWDLLLPVGISFYTFQAVSYVIDVYRGDIDAERNFFKYALFVSFFPQLVAGPIERSKNLLSQIREIERISLWDFERVKSGILLMLWGFFQKLMIADRASILVNTVYNSYQKYGFIELLTATVLFAFQIYCDFDGYTNIARGAAEVMGIRLMRNFRQPYLAKSIHDFWKRWHISLTSWFTDYLYIPLGGSRKGIKRRYINIMIVFLVSGLWHGASWNFVFWGLLHGIYQIAGNIKNTFNNKKEDEKKLNPVISFLKSLAVFLLVDFAWLFFRADSLGMGIDILKQMSICFQTTPLLELNLNGFNWMILICAIVILFTVDMLHEKGYSIKKFFYRQNYFSRVLVYVMSVMLLLYLGIYGTDYDISQFIYFQF